MKRAPCCRFGSESVVVMVRNGYESYKTVAKERIKDDLVQSGSKATKASVDREAKKRWSKLPDSSREIWAKGGSK